ncbi:YycH family regulatory protein [Caryophanon tenue]|uniref:Regulatory protein YycH domain-containing protein n=1 Tax=Caryophanon tenue TaxID=33978 RepID=A0A1C0YL99_9BACL|nr:two-component system activity regulator YycH [Caryophanon tenue]OCS87921.1 hypothetical protein A6M13_08085 [Caryophanon tenue]
MRYIEQVKTGVLLFLVALSLLLTFMIWTYKPDYGVIEEKEVEEIIIDEPTSLSKVLRPYKLVFRGESGWRGTVSTSNVDNVLNVMHDWTLTDLTLITNTFDAQQFNDLVRTPDHMTMIFAEEVPIALFREFFQLDVERTPNMSFDRFVVYWDAETKAAQAYFVNLQNAVLYEAQIMMPAPNDDEMMLHDVINASTDYTEITRDNATSLYVVKDAVETVQYTYHTGEASVDKFVRSLFSDYSSVNKQTNSAASEQYISASEKMDVNPIRRQFKYVNPRGRAEQLTPDELIYQTFRFINSTGSFTGDFRYVYGDLGRNLTQYQLFVQGFPVYSEDSSTFISLTWRGGRPYEYDRPYYTLDIADMQAEALMSGTAAISTLSLQNPELLQTIDDLVVGYTLKHTENSRIFVLEPSWFAIQGMKYIRIDPNMIGGTFNGLE